MSGKDERMGKVAHILYKGGIKGEAPVDDRSTGEPLRVSLGFNAVPRGIEEVLYEMEVGERREVELPPAKGYGQYNEEGVKWYSRAAIENNRRLKVGDSITCTNKYDGSMLPGRVIDEHGTMLLIDVNHPFAGKTTVYWVELVDLEQDGS